MGRPGRKKLHPTTQYARDVIEGKILANKWVRLACKRHLDGEPEKYCSIKKCNNDGYWFDESAATHIIDFFSEFLIFYEGAFDGQPFNLTPNQIFIVGSIFGWKRSDGFRRFRTAYVEQAKGQGKSPISAGIGLYGLVFDDEPGAEIYAAAVTREQAGILFRDARLYAEASGALKEVLDIGQHNIAYISKNSFFRPVSSEHRGLDGKRPHFALIDEIHEHPNDLVVRKMSAGTKGRRQSLIFEITNAGYDRQSICYQHHEYTTKILEGTIQDDAWFGIITGLDVCPACEKEGKTIPQDGCPDCDDWRDEKVWEKANPNLNYLGAPFRDYLRRQVEEAKAMPGQEYIVKRLNFCIWTDAITRWIPADQWAACQDRSLRREDFAGQSCYLAFDLANKIDISALIQIFRMDELLIAFGLYYLTEETIKTSKNAPQYRQWVRNGYIIQTSGAMTDYAYIEKEIKEIDAITPIQELAFDPHEATYLVNNVMEWLGVKRCIEIMQGPAHISEPMKQLEGLVYSQQIKHNGDPVLMWMMANVMKREGRAHGPVKYYYPTKTNEDNKIDGAVALIMAVGRAMLKSPGSIYETQGVMSV